MFQSILPKKTPLKAYPSYFCVFFVDLSLSDKIAERYKRLYFSSKSHEQGGRAFLDDLGHWELKMLYPKMARGRHGLVLFLSFFIYFARLVAIIGGD